jgi:hypothetical protein
MTFQVVNLAYYKGKKDRLFKDIIEFNPTVLILAWRFSVFGDVAMNLRREAVFARMFINFEIRKVTKNISSTASKDQVEVILKMFDYEHVFLSGSSGSGKTLCPTEILKNKVARMKDTNKDIRVMLVDMSDCDNLLQTYDTAYLAGI